MIGIIALLALILVSGWYWWSSARPGNLLDESVDAAAEPGDPAINADENTAAALPGTWQSTEDARFIRIFDANGTVTDRYEGDDDVTTSGTWNFVADPSKEQAELPVVEGMQVIKLQFPEEVMYFAVADLSATTLTMIYVSGNGALEFRRI